MAIDDSIFARFAPKSVAQYDREAYEAEGARQTNALQALTLAGRQRSERDALRQDQEWSGMRNALSTLGAGATDDQRVNALRGLGTQTGFSQADTLEKSQLERQKTGAEVRSKASESEKRAFETARDRLALMNSLLAGATDEASYAQAAQQAAQLGIDPAQIPPTYDPAFIAAARQRAVTEQQRLENAARERGLDLQQSSQQQQLQIAQMNDARARSEGAANRAVTMRGQNMVDARSQTAEQQEPSGNERKALSTQLGVPIAEADPWRGMSQKGKEASQRSVRTSADKRIGEMEQSAADAAAMRQDVARFLELQGTDGITAQGPLMGRTPALSAQAQEMDAIADRLTPKMREPGSGATSDFDAKMFRSATVGRTKKPEANTAIAEAVKARAQLLQDRSQFMRDYITVNGHLDGAERQWSSYLEANPIFDRRSETPKINPTRSSYRQFFGSRAAPATTVPAGAGAPGRTVDFSELR